MAKAERVNGYIIVTGAKNKEEAEKTAKAFSISGMGGAPIRTGENPTYVSRSEFNQSVLDAQRKAFDPTFKTQADKDAEREYRNSYNDPSRIYAEKQMDRLGISDYKDFTNENVINKRAEQTRKVFDKFFEDYKKKNAAGAETTGSEAKTESQMVQDTEARKKQNEEDFQTLKTLEAERDYWAEKQRQAGDMEVMQRDLAQIEAMSPEDLRALEEYASGRDVDFIESLNATQNGIQAGRAEQKASALLEKYGEENIKQLARTLKRLNNAQMAAQMNATAQAQANQNALLSSLATIPAGMVGGITGIVSQAADISQGRGEYSTLDPNSSGNIFNQYRDTVRGTVGQNLADKGALGTVASYGYQAGMSMLDMGARALVGGAPGATALAATQSFSSALADATARGIDPENALGYATVVAGIDALTEKIPLDEVFKTAKGGAKPLAAMFRQAGIEIATEEASLIGSTLADAWINQDKSARNQQIADLVGNGASYADALKEADRALLNEAKSTALVSGLSGGFSSLGASLMAKMNQRARQTQGQQMSPETQGRIEEAKARVEQKAPQQPQQNDFIRQFAEDVTSGKVQEQMNKPEMKFTPEDVRAAADKMFGVQRENTSPALEQALTQLTEKGNVSNSVAEMILQDSQALAALQEQTGIEISGTKSERRNAVKEAVSMLQTVKDVVNNQSAQPETVQVSTGEEVQGAGAPELDKMIDFFSREGDDVPLDMLIDASSRNPEIINVLESVYGKKIESIDDLYDAYTAYAEAKDTTLPVVEQKDNQVSEEKQQNIENNGPGTPAANFAGTQESAIPEAAVPPANPVSAPLVDTSGGEKVSKIYSNTYRRSNDPTMRAVASDIKREAPETTSYQAKTERGERAIASERTNTPEKIAYERDYLASLESWGAEDVKTAKIVINQLKSEGDLEGVKKVFSQMRNHGTNAGQLIQAMAEYTRNSPIGAAMYAIDEIDRLGAGGIREGFYEEQGFEQWSASVEKTALEIADQIENVPEGDTEAMKAIINELSQFRKTTGFLKPSGKLRVVTRLALKNIDFTTAKQIANQQLSMLPNDFRKRSKMEQAHAIRVQNLLNSFVSTNRNLQSNIENGLFDSIADSFMGRIYDKTVLSKKSGIRTVGNDLKHPKEYYEAAKNALNFAVLAIELDIPMESLSAYDVGVKYGENFGSVNAFSSQGNQLERFFAAYSRWMSYELGATDAVFSGGSGGAVKASLQDLGSTSGLNSDDIAAISKDVGQRRTFKQERLISGLGKDIKQAINKRIPGVGNALSPFIEVSSNVIQTGIDRTPLGVIQSIFKTVQLSKEAKNLNKMSQKDREEFLIKQRNAASDFGRGSTGSIVLALAAAAAKAGVITYSDSEDWDKENALKNRYLDGVKVNWSALKRVFSGEKDSIRAGDLVTGLDSLGQAGLLFGLSAVLADDGLTFGEKATESALAVFNQVLNSPTMVLLKDTVEFAEALFGSDDPQDIATAAGTFAGDLASGVYPQFFRNIAYAADPVMRDTSADNALDSTVNRFKSGLPGLSHDLPAKYDPLTGDVQRRDASNGEAVWNRIFAPDAAHRYKENELATMLDEISAATGDTSIYPASTAPANFKYGGEVVSVSGKESTELYQKTYAESVTELFTELKNSDGFQALTPESQAEELKEALAKAKDIAEAAVVGYENFSNDARNEMNRLAKEVGDTSVYYTPTARSVTYTDTDGDKIKRDLTDVELTAIRNAEQTTANVVMSKIVGTEVYSKLSPDQQTQALKYVQEYSRNTAKADNISGYYSNPSNWENDTTVENAPEYILKKVSREAFYSFATEYFSDVKRGHKTEQSSAELKSGYDDYRNSPSWIRSDIMESAEGNTKRYLLSRGSGVGHEDTLRVIDSVSKLGDTGDYAKYGEIARVAGGDTRLADALMKAYMPDYNPKAKSPNRTELKYNALREELGLPPSSIVEIKNITDSIKGRGAKANEIDAIAKLYDINREEATKAWYVISDYTEYQERYR